MATPFQTLTRLIGTFSLLAASASHAQISAVGIRQIQSGGMPITLVYPTTAPANLVTQGAFTVHVAHNAPPLAAPATGAAGKRSLIVLSHGSAGSALPDHALAATLARAGFVVAQPEHPGDNWQDFSRAGPESWTTRPQEVSATIDAVTSDSMLGPLVRTDRVGVHGMSAGGVTGLALAGAQWRMLNLIQHCAQNLEEDIGFCLNGLGQQPVQQALRKGQFFMGRMLTETSAPTRFITMHGGISPASHPDPRPDSRIAAVSLLVPVAVIFSPDSLTRIRIPVGLTIASNDEVLVPRFHSEHVLRHCSSCRVLSRQTEAGHFDGLWPWPTDVARKVAATQMRGGMPRPAFSSAERQSAFDRIASFFAQELNTP